jgi:hypothetical protein
MKSLSISFSNSLGGSNTRFLSVLGASVYLVLADTSRNSDIIYLRPILRNARLALMQKQYPESISQISSGV